MDRPSGPSVRLKLTLSYAGFATFTGALLLVVVWLLLLRYVPRGETVIDHGNHVFVSPGRGELLRDFAPAAATSGAVLLVFSLIGGWFLAGRTLAPLVHITEATRLAATGSLSHRIRLAGRRDELRELADAFDGMLEQLERHMAEQQRFAANASHELRTPLAVMSTLLEVAQRDPQLDVGELLRRLQVVNARAIDLTEELLLLSRAEQRSFDRAPVDLSLLVEESIETLIPFAEDRCVVIEPSADPAPATGSSALLVQLATNLIHNAIVHNLPERGTVWVTTNVQQDWALLAVENTGEQLAPELVSRLVEPFLRGAERTHGGHPGVGLGLAIAKSITEAHDGSLTLTPRAEGGLSVVVRLPIASPSASREWQPD